MKKIFLIFLLSLCCFQFVKAQKFVIGTHSPSGFFSIFFGALNKIIWAKKNNKTPVVYWGRDCLYYQHNGYNGSLNVWEYYFAPVSKLQYKYGDKIYKPYPAPNGFAIPYHAGCYNKQFHKFLKFYMHDIIKKNIHIKQNILNKVKKFYNNFIFKKKTIGIHIRGTDKKSEAKPMPLMLILNTAKSIAKKFPSKNYQFFIATDDMRVLNSCKSILKKVIHYDSHRSIDGRPIHYQRNKIAGVIGEEILIEALLLSKCDVFIHTRSNVATAVMFFNPNIKNIFLQ